jgi:hypothetical protein
VPACTQRCCCLKYFASKKHERLTACQHCPASVQHICRAITPLGAVATQPVQDCSLHKTIAASGCRSRTFSLVDKFKLKSAEVEAHLHMRCSCGGLSQQVASYVPSYLIIPHHCHAADSPPVVLDWQHRLCSLGRPAQSSSHVHSAAAKLHRSCLISLKALLQSQLGSSVRSPTHAGQPRYVTWCCGHCQYLYGILYGIHGAVQSQSISVEPKYHRDKASQAREQSCCAAPSALQRCWIRAELQRHTDKSSCLVQATETTAALHPERCKDAQYFNTIHSRSSS